MGVRKRLSLPYMLRVVWIIGVLAVVSIFNKHRTSDSPKDLGKIDLDHPSGVLSRKLLTVIRPQVHNETRYKPGHRHKNGSAYGRGPNRNETETIVCTPPAFHEFPPDVFSAEQRSHGAIVLHFILAMYMFTGLALVCDIYFVASLEKISDKLHLSEDVAGATFMAAGSSAPELFTSVIGVFIAKGDVGVGTIVGSAVFNLVFVIGLCGVLAGQIVTLTWYPLLRDSAFYSLSVIVLFLSFLDGGIQWYEATVMLILYALYILMMKFNAVLQAWVTARVHFFEKGSDDSGTILPPAGEKKYYGNYEIFDNEIEDGGPVKPQKGPKDVLPIDEFIRKKPTKLSFEDACFRFQITRRFKPLTRFRAATRILICERRKFVANPSFIRRQKWKTFSCDSEASSYTKAVRRSRTMDDPDTFDDWKRLPSWGDGIWHIVKWVISVPLYTMLYVTVPDCRKERWDAWFMATFVLSIVWIAIYSYIMVWMVTVIGFTLGIPDSIMGITFLAAGTSVPDAMASVMVARQGQGDMAVSNTIGSNVFDILIGLALPWFIKTAMVSPGISVHINSNGMVFSVILLFLTVVLTIGAIHYFGWKLERRLGALLLASYAVFVVFSMLIEFNVFGFVNPPMCLE